MRVPRVPRGLQVIRRIGSDKTGIGAIVQTLSTNILIQALNVSTGVVTARILAPQGRGELAAMIMWPQFLATALSFGLQISLIYQMRNGAERHGDFVATALLLSLLAGAFSAVVGILGIPYWLHGYSPQVIVFAQWAMLTAPLSSLGTLLYTSAQAVQEFGRFNRFRMIPAVLVLCALLILAFFHLLTPRTAALSYMFSGMPIIALNLIWVVRRFDLSLRNVRGCARLLLTYGIRAWGMDLIGAISDQVDRVLVVAFLSPHEMGLYVVTQSSARLFVIVPGALSLVMTPKIVLLGPKGGAQLLVRTARITLMFMCLGAIPLGIVASFALHLVYGAAFTSSATVFRILLAEAVLGGFTWLLAQGYAALGKPGRATIQQMLGLATSVPLLLILVPRYGIDGACIALLTSTCLRMSFAVLSYRLLFGEKLSHFVPRFSDLAWILQQIRSRQSGEPPRLKEESA